MPPLISTGIDFGAGLGKNALGQAITSATVGTVTHLQNAGTVAAQAGEVAGTSATTASQVGTSALTSSAGAPASALSSAMTPLTGLGAVAAPGGGATRAVASQPNTE